MSMESFDQKNQPKRLDDPAFYRSIKEKLLADLEELMTDKRKFGGIYSGDQAEQILESIKQGSPIPADKNLVDFVIKTSQDLRLSHAEVDDLLERVFTDSDQYRSAQRLEYREQMRGKK
jgi:hypothetical protein